MYQGKKVRLREYRNNDVQEVLRQVNDYQSVRYSATGLILPATYDDQMRWISQQSAMTRGEYQFAIETLRGQYIGGCGFQRVDWKNRAAGVGILIGNPAFRGKGYGSDAIRVLCLIGFAEMNLHKINLSVIADNAAAIRCYEACGFTVEGRLRDEVFREDAYHDLIAMGLLRDEWRERISSAAANDSAESSYSEPSDEEDGAYCVTYVGAMPPG